MGHFASYVAGRDASLNEGPLSMAGKVANTGLGLAAGFLAGVLGGVVGGIEGLGGIPDESDPHDPKKRTWSSKENGPFGALIGSAYMAIKRAWQFARHGWGTGSNLVPENAAPSDPADELVRAMRPLLGSGNRGLQAGADRVAAILKAVPPEQHQAILQQAAERLGVEITQA